MTAYYNEIDPHAAEWLRNLIQAGHIAPGVVDERSIEDVSPDDLADYTQCHFFAGIGVWSYALRLAGWPDNRPIWTGSCPCQPFSAAGKGAGFDDERHLWPHLHYLIKSRKPPVVLGEQVASKDGLAWFDLVQADLEGTGYTGGGVDLCAAGVGAPHIRQRLYWFAEWLADTNNTGSQGWGCEKLRQCSDQLSAWPGGTSDRLANTECDRLNGRGNSRQTGRDESTNSSSIGGLAIADSYGCKQRHQAAQRTRHRNPVESACGNDTNIISSPTNGLWRDPDWLFCQDGKWRPVEPGTFPLAHGAPARVGRLRAYGNAINAQVAKEFIAAYMEAVKA